MAIWDLSIYDYYPEPPEEPLPRCPVCGEETDTFYQNQDGDIVGCDQCVKALDAWDYLED